jgi:glycerophosphoryl diester phosphodiesterase
VPTRFVAHRGGAARWPENSLTAFRGAVAAGARLLECDVHLTRDGEVVVIHDPTLERTTDGTGAVEALTAADLRQVRLRARDGRLAEEGVPTLAEVLAVAAPAAVTMLVEIKTPGEAVERVRRDGGFQAVPGRRYPGLEKKVLDALAQFSVTALVMAFNPDVLAEIRTLAPGQPSALLVDRHHVVAAGATGVDAVGWAGAAGATFLGLHHSLCDAAVMAAARAAGVLVAVFTVNDEAEMTRLTGIGVDAIITDRPELIPPDAEP